RNDWNRGGTKPVGCAIPDEPARVAMRGMYSVHWSKTDPANDLSHPVHLGTSAESNWGWERRRRRIRRRSASGASDRSRPLERPERSRQRDAGKRHSNPEAEIAFDISRSA